MNYAPNQLAKDPNKAGALFAFCLQIYAVLQFVVSPLAFML